MNISEEIHKHPYVVGGAVIVGGIVLYVLASGGGGSSSSGVSTVASADEESEQIAAASNAQAAQTAAASQAATQQAQVQNNQILAEYQAANNQNDTELLADLVGQQTQQQANAEAASVQNNTIGAQETAALAEYQDAVSINANNNSTALTASENSNATQLSGLNSELGYETNLNNLQATLTNNELTDYNNYVTQGQSDQNQLDQGILSAVEAAGLNHGTQSLENSLTAVLSGLEGDSNVGVAAEGATGIGDIASANEANSIFSSIAKLGSTIAGGLFA